MKHSTIVANMVPSSHSSNIKRENPPSNTRSSHQYQEESTNQDEIFDVYRHLYKKQKVFSDFNLFDPLSSNKDGYYSWELQVTDRYDFLQELGRGSYGAVAKARDKRSGKIVAVKKMRDLFLGQVDTKRLYREMHILRHLSHPSIVCLLNVICPVIDDIYRVQYEEEKLHKLRQSGLFDVTFRANASETDSTSKYHALQIDPDGCKEALIIDQTPESISKEKIISKLLPSDLGNIYLIFEFIDTDLSKIIRSEQYFAERHIEYMLYQLLEGVHYLHKCNVIHRDLKPANILIECAECKVKIADFGLSRVVEEDVIGLIGSDRNSKASEVIESPNKSVQQKQQEEDEAVSSLQSLVPDNISDNKESISTNSVEYSKSQDAPVYFPEVQKRLTLRRGLTRHVATRWYRAPEIILLQPYTSAVDMWSIGCIFAELLSMLKSNVSDFRRRKALFPGENCGELSAEDLLWIQQQHRNTSEYLAQMQETYENDRSQLNVIFDVLGTPTEEDLAHIDSTTATLLKKIKPKPNKSLETMYPGASENALNLLKSMLRFIPSKRITAEAALEHPYFDNIRELISLSSSRASSTPSTAAAAAASQHTVVPMNVAIEKIDESPDRLRDSIVREVLFYRKREEESTPNISPGLLGLNK